MSTEQRQLRNREAEAMQVWDSLPAEERNYKTVADRMSITPGRAAVYVRDALKLSDRATSVPA